MYGETCRGGAVQALQGAGSSRDDEGALLVISVAGGRAAASFETSAVRVHGTVDHCARTSSLPKPTPLLPSLHIPRAILSNSPCRLNVDTICTGAGGGTQARASADTNLELAEALVYVLTNVLEHLKTQHTRTRTRTHSRHFFIYNYDYDREAWYFGRRQG